MLLANSGRQLSQYDIWYYKPNLLFNGETLKALKSRWGIRQADCDHFYSLLGKKEKLV